MADNVVASAAVGSGATFATDQRASDSVHFPLTKLVWGALDTFTVVDTGAGAIPIADGGNSITVDNGGTFATQAAQSGTWNVTNVSGTVSLPTGASTSAKQPALGTAGTASTDVISIQGITSMTPLLVTPAANSAVNVAQVNGVTPLMGTGVTGTGSIRVTIATDQAQLTNKLLVTPDANSAINLAQVGGNTTVTGGVNGTLAIGGNVATNVAIGTNPINLGAQAVSAENTAVTATRMAQLVCDLVGKLIVLPYSNPENLVSGAITSAMTGTTSTSLIAAPAAGLRNYITQITISNAHATVGTDVAIQDGNGGTTIYTIPAAAVYGGAAITFPAPLRQPTTATAIYVANVTTGASVKASASGFKGI